MASVQGDRHFLVQRKGVEARRSIKDSLCQGRVDPVVHDIGEPNFAVSLRKLFSQGNGIYSCNKGR